MTTSTSPKHSFEQDAQTLAQLSQKLCRNSKQGQDWGQFQAVLEQMLSHGDPAESVILNSATRALLARQDDRAYYWLLREVERECELQYVPDPVTGKGQACVLFAIPVTAPRDIALPTSLYAGEHFEELHNILEDAGVFDSQAHVRLVPRLFTVQELRNRSKSELRALTRSLGQQVLGNTKEILELSDPVFMAGMAERQDQSAGEHVQLRYLVGVAVVHPEFLSNLTPARGSPSQGKQAKSDDEDDDNNNGWLSDGRWWGQVFCEKLEDCLLLLGAGFSLEAPQGFHDDIRNGMALLREQQTLRTAEYCIFENYLDETSVVVEEWPIHTPDKGVIGFSVMLVDVDDRDKLYAHIIWPKFPHESVEDAVDNLHAAMNILELTPADPALSSEDENISYLVH